MNFGLSRICHKDLAIIKMEAATQFIDAESGANYGKENSFEQVILKQMQHCVNVLNEDVYGGSMKSRSGKAGQSETYIEDVREKIINSVDTFRMLVLGFIGKAHAEELEKVKKEIQEFKDKIGESTMIVPGRGAVKIKELGSISQSNPAWKALSTYTATKYRMIFEILIKVYTKHKMEIQAFSEE